MSNLEGSLLGYVDSVVPDEGTYGLATAGDLKNPPLVVKLCTDSGAGFYNLNILVRIKDTLESFAGLLTHVEM